MQSAALYLRSSKDRHDVSIDSQRRDLTALATNRGLAVVETFQDAVERADDEQRPGFQALLRSLKHQDRQWNHILVLDTARIARNDQHLAAAFNYECEKRDIKVVYLLLPETNTIMDVVFRQVARAFDQLHSLMSKEKGLGGMAENVRRGWRAGGRAPMGYRLEHTDTGAVREGAAVTKSRLVQSPDASKVQSYMKARAAGTSRKNAASEAGLGHMIDSTLIGMEWNALTYAGHTVWNVHAERIKGGGYKGGSKRRPRADWVIQYDTHERLISTEEAETLLANLEAGRPKKYRTRGSNLLTGLLLTPDGKGWHSDGDGCYRVGKGRRISQQSIDAAIVGKVKEDLISDTFVRELTAEARRMSAPPPESRLKPLRDQVTAISSKISRFAELAAESEKPRPFIEKITELEHSREKYTSELAGLESAQQAAEVLRAVSEKDIRKLLAGLADSLDAVDREALKELIASLLEKIELCPTTHTARLHYKIAAGELVASPRRTQDFPTLRLMRLLAA